MRTSSVIGVVLVSGGLLTSGSPRSTQFEPKGIYQHALSNLRRGYFDESLMEVRRANTLWRRADTEWHWMFRLLEAEILLEQAEYRRGRILLETDADACQKHVRMDIRRRVLLAKLFLRMSDFGSALPLLNEARELAGGDEAVARAEIDIIHGQILARQHELERAERTFHTAQMSALSAGDEFLHAAAVNNLGMIQMMRSRCDESIPNFYEALLAFRRLGADHYVVIAANNLGLCYSNLGDFDKALEYRHEALRLIKPSARMAEVLGETGLLYLDQDQPLEAIPYFRRALEASRRFNYPSEAARSASNLALALREAGEWDAAEKMNQQALGLKPDPRSVPFIQLNQAAIARGRGKSDEARQVYEGVVAANLGNPVVLWQSHADLANLHLDAGDWEQASQSFEAGIRVVEQSRAELNGSDHKITFLARLIQFYQDYVDALMDRNLDIRALEVADSSRARILAEGLSLKAELPRGARGAEELKALARRSNSTWLSYWIAPKRSFLWVVSPHEIRTFVLPPAAEISDAVERYRGFIETALRDPMQTQSDAGRWLFQELIGKAQRFIPSGGRVVIVPDGPLHQLNFETLPVYEGGQRYWIEDVEIAVAPSFGISIGHAQLRARAPRSVLLIGNPESPGPEFPKLAYADAEIAKLNQRFRAPTTKVITGREANPAAWLASQPERYSLIHIAAHGEANRRSPLDSALILSPGERGFKLYARDIMQVPLRADLVTISACRSSGARAYAGEGLVGLARAFLQAGAYSVIAGLWDVADQSTSEIMDRVYAGIAEGARPAESLRKAKLSILRRAYPKPYYWGPFQFYTRRPAG